jgi:hypothetical protein
MAKDLLNRNLPKIVVAWYTPIRGMSYEYLYISHRGSLWKEQIGSALTGGNFCNLKLFLG